MVERGRESAGGVCVLRWSVCLPSERVVREFYDRMGTEVVSFCRGELSESARRIYEDDPDPRKKFRFAPLRYELIGRVTFAERGLLSVRMDVSLRGGGREPILRTQGQVFDAVTGQLLSPAMAAKLYDGSKLPKELRDRPGGIWIDRGGIRQNL